MGYTLKDDCGAAGSSDKAFGANANGSYMAHSWTTGSAYTLTKLAARLLVGAGAPTMLITARIFSNASGDPNAQLAVSTNTVDAATLTGSPAYYDFLFAGLALSNATRYFAVLSVSAYDGSNYPAWRYASGAAEYRDNGPDGSTWYDDSSSAQGAFRTYESDGAGSGATSRMLTGVGN